MPLVQQLIQQGGYVDVKDFAGWTPLHEACAQGHFSVAHLLLTSVLLEVLLQLL